MNKYVQVRNPKDFKKGSTGHAEALEIEYDPNYVKYEDLLELFWRIHDPTTINRQGNDRGTQYRSAVFYHNEEQKQAAYSVKEKVQSHFKSPIVTEIVPACTFYNAEEYHQKYLDKNPGGYCNHRYQW
jgi:peptide-methionine (S)-S-oxide reductase